MEETIKTHLSSATVPPTLLLHSCCAPCSSAVITALSGFFRITVFYYNPNIDEREEYLRRAAEQQRLIREMRTVYPVDFLEGLYEREAFLAGAQPLSEESEGGKRCTFCYALRLAAAARQAAELASDFFTSTLTISPMKDAALINKLGEAAAKKNGARWLPSDFKKKNGFKRSVELSGEYNLYRQDWCGCSFSKQESERRRAAAKI